MLLIDNPRFTKIICTLGPATSTYEKLKELAEAGMNVARLNFSHGSHEDHKKSIDMIRKISEEIERPISILQDLQGPKIRVETFENGFVDLDDGQKFILTVRDIVGNDKEVSVTYKNLHKSVKKDDNILLDDGNIRLKALTVNGNDVTCEVIYGGRLSDHKGLNLPNAILKVDALTEKDIEDLNYGLENGVDFVALSFVQKPEDVTYIKKLIADKGKKTPVIAKIEKPQAVEQIEEIVDRADVIMIARGDLGVEMKTEEVPAIQKRVIDICNKKGKPVITATQMLESMIKNARPTRAEASDVANAVLDGSDAVMLSGETSVGDFPVEAVKLMRNIIHNIEKSESNIDRGVLLKRKHPVHSHNNATAIGYAACYAAEILDAKFVICLTQSGYSAKMISRFRTNVPILAITPKLEAYNRSAMYWGVKAVLVEEFHNDFDRAIFEIIGILKAKNIVEAGDRVVFTAGGPFYKKLPTNTIRLELV